MTQDLIGRVQRLLMQPKAEWDVIDGETVETQSLITGYVAPLAAIPAVAGFIGMSVFGFGTIKIGMGAGLSMAVTQFVFAILFVFVFAFIINALAPSFGAQKNFNQALKVTAYYPTAAWVAGIFQLIPILGILTLVGAIYSLYLLFVGLPKIMKPADDKGTVYTIVSIVVAIVAAVVLGAISSVFTPSPKLGDYAMSDGRGGSLSERTAQLEKAAESGDVNAVLGALGGLSGGDGEIEVVDMDALRDFAPNRLAGMPRTALSVDSLSVPFKAVMMVATYEEGGKSMDLKVTSSPMVSAMLGMAGFAGAEFDRRTDDGYERAKKKGDHVVMEQWSKSSKRGRYARAGNGFMVEAEGDGVDIKDLEKAVSSISDNDLKKLPKA